VLNTIERIIISRLKPWCGEPPCEKYLKTEELQIKEYPDRLEIFCQKHGNSIQNWIIGSNCLIVVLRPVGQAEISAFSGEK